ncbi:hypothetical protein BKA63DRAFT_485388 [Paraphoma chrysanthemicola]|nr:hypothetical protein BKA63DRAFT_485388 [Paraphoma chrysanthemicola]
MRFALATTVFLTAISGFVTPSSKLSPISLSNHPPAPSQAKTANARPAMAKVPKTTLRRVNAATKTSMMPAYSRGFPAFLARTISLVLRWRNELSQFGGFCRMLQA